jgi:hypothetical protein
MEMQLLHTKSTIHQIRDDVKKNVVIAIPLQFYSD